MLSRLVMYSVLISEQYSARADAMAAGIGGVQLDYRLSLFALPPGPLGGFVGLGVLYNTDLRGTFQAATAKRTAHNLLRWD